MPSTRLRAAPAIVLLVLLALLVLQAWVALAEDDVSIDTPAAGLDSVRWLGTVGEDGRLAVTITYTFNDETAHPIDIRVPDGARFLAFNGTPIEADIGKYASGEARGKAVVSYELPGAVARYRDGALLRLARSSDSNGGDPSIDGDQGLFPCPRCYVDDIGYGDAEVDGALFVPGADHVGLHFLQLDSVRAQVDTDGNAVRFAGVDPHAEDVSMLATLPSSAVSKLPIGDGSVQAALKAATDELGRSDRRINAPEEPSDARPVTAIVLSALFVGLLVWVIGRLWWARRIARASIEPGDAPPADAPPDDLPPALVGAVIGGVASSTRPSIAATVIDLARRDVIGFEGNDLRRFVVDVPQGATSDSPFEREVLTALRPKGDPMAAARHTGPPLWGATGPLVARRLHAALVRAARKQRLVRAVLPAMILTVTSLTMAVVAIVGSTGGAKYAWVMAFLGPIIAVGAAGAAGTTLTKRGLHERDAWLPYAAGLRRQGEWPLTNSADPPSVDAALAYAAAVGAAPAVVDALAPDVGPS